VPSRTSTPGSRRRSTPATAWTLLAVQVGLSPRRDPHWAALVEQLAALSRAGADAPALLRAAAAEAPLPDEYQAAAVWWRIARHTGPAVLSPDPGSASADPLRPGWLPQLSANLSPAAAAQLVEDPHWAAVAAAVNRAIEHGIPAADVLRQPVGLDGDPVPDHALADALIYRAATLADPAPPDPYQPAGAPDEPGFEPDDPDLAPPEDLHMLTYPGSGDTPLNLTEAGYRDGPQFDHYLRTGDLQPPFPEETIPTSETVLTPQELDAELFHAAQHRRWMDPWQPTDEQQRRLEARAAEAEFSPPPPNGSPTSTPKPPTSTNTRTAGPGPRPTSPAVSAPISPATRTSNPATPQPGSPPWSPTSAGTAPPTTSCSPPAWPRPPAPARPSTGLPPESWRLFQ